MGEKGLRQEAAGWPCLLSPVLEQSLLELSRGERGIPEGNSGSRFCFLGCVNKGTSRFDLGITKAHNSSALREYHPLPLSPYRLVNALPSSIKPLVYAEESQIIKLEF